MSTLNEDAKSLFFEALDLESAEELDSFLQLRCGTNAELRDRVECLIRANQRAGKLLGGSYASSQTEDMPGFGEQLGTSIGPYKLMEQIGEGGMGTVFVAQQESPIRRKVALKLIKAGMDTKSVVARFEAERQALAMMDHPNIAKVLDAGMTESGRPYFAMEYVRGVPITEYCDRNRLTISERLELFIHVCHAIQHAHQKGIIHRDIKPSNVLVTLHDGKPVPKVIDFGVAKAISARLTDKTIYTEHLQIVGTLLYMSPEQAELSGLDIDTRSDVYSLGVLLYELLTGTTPFQKDELRKAGLDEQRRVLREKEPPRASVRISSLGAKATNVAESRKTDAKRLHQQLSGDLDWIVLKALEKDRTRRYETANGFAEDISRCLSDAPISARPPSYVYLLRKNARRHRIALTVVAIVVAALTGGLWVAWEGKREAEVANERLRETIESFHKSLIEMCLLYAVQGDVAKVESLLRDASDEFPPDWESTLIGLAQLHRGENEIAVARLKQAISENNENVSAKALLTLALVHSGRWAEWAPLMEELLEAMPSSKYHDFDELFLGYAWFYFDFEESRARIQRVVDRHPSWHIAQAMLANVGAHVAELNGDPELMKQVLEQNRIPEVLVTDENRFALMMCCYVYRTALVVLPDDDPKVPEIRSKAEEYAKRLAKHPNYSVGTLVLALFHEREGHADLALESCRRLLRHGHGMLLHWACPAFLKAGEAEQIVEELGNRELNDLESRTALAYILALSKNTGDQDDARRIYEEEVVNADTWLERGLVIQIPLLLKQPDIARRQCVEWLNERPQPPLTKRFEDELQLPGLLGGAGIPMIRCIAKMNLTESAESEGETYGAWYFKWQTAMNLYANGETQRAIDKFNECVRAGSESRIRVFSWYAEGFRRQFEKELRETNDTSSDRL
jgi:serine/threonine protein kinase/tetratricopeptide (TPR) repeat protein